MREKIIETIEKHGTFNGDIMGFDTYVVFKDDLVDALLKLFEGGATDNRCVCCGAIIPEGRQVCPNCEKKLEERKL